MIDVAGKHDPCHAASSVASPLVGDGLADPRSRYRTWGQNRSVRLPLFDYRNHVPYHVIVCSARRQKPFLIDRISMMVCDEITALADRHDVYVGAFCLMPDHLHLLMSPNARLISIPELVGRLKGKTTNASWMLGWNGKLWQERFYDHIVRRDESVVDTARYIYENPERAGLSGEYGYRFVDGGCCD